MKITSSRDASTLNIALEGSLDNTTSPDLDALLKSELNETVTHINFDFSGLEYISSAGLRVVFAAQKLMKQRNGKMVFRNVNEAVKDVFDMTGFSDFLTIE